MRYYGAYATRRRVWWRQRGVVLVDAPGNPCRLSPRATGPHSVRAAAAGPNCCGSYTKWRSRCARTRLRRVPRGGAMAIVAFITESAVVRRILAHLERRGIETRAGPWADVAAAPG